MARLFYEGFSENSLQKVQNAQNLLQTLSAQRNLPVTQILSLIDQLIEAIQPKLRVETDVEATKDLISIPAPTQSMHLSDDIVDELRTMLREGIQQLKSNKQGSETEAPAIDTSKIVSEIKNMISEEIKSISADIVNQIVGKFPVGLPSSSSSRASSGGQIADDAPEIKVVAPAADGERRSRPKLSDMINSIVVSE
jgi:gas vesicle protein